MRRFFQHSFLFVSGLMILLSCSVHETRDRLSDVESYIMERPDSALSVLDTMDRSLLTTDRLKAHHALLHAMALDKNYIDVTDDSIASVAVDYYTRKGPKKYEARALYYLGLAYYYQGAYNKAILEFTKAENIASESDSLYLGFIKVAQADTYAKTYNEQEVLNFICDAYNIYTAINNDYYKQVAELRLAQAYFNHNEYFKADSLLNKLLNNEALHDNIRIVAELSYAFLLSSTNFSNYLYSTNLYQKIYSDYSGEFMSNKDYWAWAYSLSKVGNKEASQSLVSQLAADTSATAYYWQYMIAKSEGRISDALYLLEKTSTKNNYEVEEALKQSLSSVQRDYYISQSENSEYKAQNRTLIMIITIISAVLAIAVILWITSGYIRKQREEKEKYLRYANEIRRQLEDAKSENYPDLKRKYMSLYQSRFETIGALYEQYSLSHGKKNEEIAIYDKVVALVDDFRNDYKDIERFESILNDDMDNIMSNLRSDMPRFKETDFAIFRFTLIGFDVTVISHMLDISMNAIYIRKSRMRKQIENTNPARKDEYLEVLDLKSPFYKKS